MRKNIIETVAQMILCISFSKCANPDLTIGESMTVYTSFGPTTYQDMHWHGNVSTTEQTQSSLAMEYTKTKLAKQKKKTLDIHPRYANCNTEQNPWETHINGLKTKLARLHRSKTTRNLLDNFLWCPQSNEITDSNLIDLIYDSEIICNHAKTLKDRANEMCEQFLTNARHVSGAERENLAANTINEQLQQRFDPKSNPNPSYQMCQGLIVNHQPKSTHITTFVQHNEQKDTTYNEANPNNVNPGDLPNMLGHYGNNPLQTINAAQSNTCKCYEKTCFPCNNELFNEVLVQESTTENELGISYSASTTTGQVEADILCNFVRTETVTRNQPSEIMSTNNQQEDKPVFSVAQHSIEKIPGYDACMLQLETISAYIYKLREVKRQSFLFANRCEECINRSTLIKNSEAFNFYCELKKKVDVLSVVLGKIIEELFNREREITANMKSVKV